MTTKLKELFVAEKIRELIVDITELMPERKDILEEGNDALNAMVLLQSKIEKPYTGENNG